MRVGFVGGQGSHNVGDHIMLKAVDERMAAAGHEVVHITYGRSVHHPELRIRSLAQNAFECLEGLDALVLGPGGVFPCLPTAYQRARPHQAIDPVWFESIPTYVVGGGYTPGWTPTDEERDLSVDWLRRCRWVGSRDQRLADLRGDVPGVVAPDFSYLSAEELLALRREDDGQKIAVACPAPPGWPSGPQANRSLLVLCDQALEAGWVVNIVPASACRGEIDLRSCIWLKEALLAPEAYILWDVPTWREFAVEVEQASAVFTCRTHPALFADVVGTPAIQVDSCAKFPGIQEVTGGTARIVRPGTTGDLLPLPETRTPEQVRETAARAEAAMAEFLEELAKVV